jgi:hypothetical protein
VPGVHWIGSPLHPLLQPPHQISSQCSDAMVANQQVWRAGIPSR